MKKRKIVKSIVLLTLTAFVWSQAGCGKAADAGEQEGTMTTALEETVQSTVAETDTEATGTVESNTVESGETVEETDTDSPKETETSEKEESGRDMAGIAAPSVSGALQVIGTQLSDEDGNPVQLRGISTHGLAWFPDYINEDCFRQFREEWQVNVIRLAMYTGEGGGYCTGGDKEALKTLVKNGVEYATNQDMYVIIDWHILSDGNPNTYLDEAKAFFDEMSKLYADYNNVLYEICNEPNGGTSWQDIKSYAEKVIPVIRANDDDGIILVGTPNWSQYVDQAAADPITGYSNIMYTLHFYAATHTDWLRNTMRDAVNAGLPVFVSEYGICDASGSGAIDRNQAQKWLEIMDELGVSYVAWNLSNKNETSAILSTGCNKTSGFAESDLSDSGKWLYQMLTGAAADGGGYSSGGSSSASGGSGGSSSASGSGSGSASGSSGGSSGGTGSASSGSGSSDSSSGTVVGTGENGIICTAELKNSWEADGKTFYQYALTISNNGTAGCDGWKIAINFTDSISLQDGWNGTFSVDGSTLHVSSVDYNGSIPAGGSVSDVGIIISGKAGIGPK